LLKGILPVLPTPYGGDGAVDPAAMRALIEFAIGAGVQGLVFPGFASEVEALTDDERISLMRVVVEANAGRVQLIAGASAPGVEAVVRFGREALDLGIRYLMIQAPKEAGTQAREVTAFFRAIADQLPGAEIVLQNAPLPRGSDLDPQTLLDVVGNVPAITYVKGETLPSGPAISVLRANPPPHLAGIIGGGGARYLIDEYERGACGTMPALELADLHVQLDRAWRSGDKAGARTLYSRSLPLLLLQAVYRMHLTKHVLTQRGVIDTTAVRAKGPKPDAMAIRDIDSWLAEVADIFTLAPFAQRVGEPA
jgi:dihydrodipicolinate synthase/N-acetylneuraminate lyase